MKYITIGSEAFVSCLASSSDAFSQASVKLSKPSAASLTVKSRQSAFSSSTALLTLAGTPSMGVQITAFTFALRIR